MSNKIVQKEPKKKSARKSVSAKPREHKHFGRPSKIIKIMKAIDKIKNKILTPFRTRTQMRDQNGQIQDIDIISPINLYSYLSDKQLYYAIFGNMSKEDRISIDVFYLWLNKDWENPLMKEEERLAGQEFIEFIEHVRANTVMDTLNLLQVGGNGWQSKAWLLERKFENWNLKRVSENHNIGTTINIVSNADMSLLGATSDNVIEVTPIDNTKQDE